MAAPIVVIAAGRVQGRSEPNGILVFRGVPYGAPGAEHASPDDGGGHRRAVHVTDDRLQCTRRVFPIPRPVCAHRGLLCPYGSARYARSFCSRERVRHVSRQACPHVSDRRVGVIISEVLRLNAYAYSSGRAERGQLWRRYADSCPLALGRPTTRSETGTPCSSTARTRAATPARWS